MSLYATPVSQSDILALQDGIKGITTPSEATSSANAINAGSQTVKSVAKLYLDQTLKIGQVCMGVYSTMISTPSDAVFQNICDNFLPAQAAIAIAYGYDPVVYDAEALGLTLGNDSTFKSAFGVPATWSTATKTAFIAVVANKTGINTTAISGWLENWITFYTANPSARGGKTIPEASAGATVGDAVGNALKVSTSANLYTYESGNHLYGLVANALIKRAEGTLTVGTTLAAQSAHALLQGES